jgi:predicted transcriptional regulator
MLEVKFDYGSQYAISFRKNHTGVYMHHLPHFDAYMRQHSDFLTAAVHETLIQLGQRIRRRRKARKLSLSQLSKITRIHRTTLGRLELGDPGVSIGNFLAVLEALQELPDIELLVSRPETPRHLRTAPTPFVDQDF